MEGYEILGFLGILRECIKVISKNGKLIATITTISIFLNSLLVFTKFSSTKTAISDLLTQETLLSFELQYHKYRYIGLFSALLISLMIVTMDHPLVLMPIVITYGLFASIFWMYFAFIWDITLVISVIEKSCCGLQALGKAGGLVKGNRLHGLALSFSYAMVTVIICISFRGNPNQKQCKKTHGEEIELQGSSEYSRIRNDRG
ncbi:hypothetical protein C3L33_05605, partial [Rhododendron williamsianum]